MPIRRYAPALIIAAALLILVIVAPSKGPATSPLATSLTGSNGAIPAPTSTIGTTTTTPGIQPTQQSAAKGHGKTGAPSSSSTVGPNNAQPTTSSTGHSTGQSAGNTKHCVGGKQFAVPGFAAAPPCQPTFSGNNGGATSSGVTSKTIEIVYYQPEESLALKAILGPAGLLPSVAQINDFLARETQFVNGHYELYGRQIHIDDYVSQSCQASPPSDACFRQDAQTVVSKFHPFAVVFPRDLTAPGFLQELSHLGVVNFGGAGLPASFDTSQAPYHFDYDMDGDTQAELLGEFYCKELANRDAIYAGSANLRSKPRAAEVLVDDDPNRVEGAQHLAAIINGCDHNGGAVIKTFSPDTSQAVVQSTTLASQAKQNGITTMIYFTDPVLPVFLTSQMTQQNYFPENLITGGGYSDFDALAQLYNRQQWAHAFGLGDLPDMAAPSSYDAGAVYRNTKGNLGPFTSADNVQGFFSVLSAGLQQAGPDLTPINFERAMLTLPSWGGTRYHSLIKFGAGDFTAVSDARMVYWDPSKRSPINGKAGSYVALHGGARYTLGQFPKSTFHIPGR